MNSEIMSTKKIDIEWEQRNVFEHIQTKTMVLSNGHHSGKYFYGSVINVGPGDTTRHVGEYDSFDKDMHDQVFLKSITIKFNLGDLVSSVVGSGKGSEFPKTGNQELVLLKDNMDSESMDREDMEEAMITDVDIDGSVSFNRDIFVEGDVIVNVSGNQLSILNSISSFNDPLKKRYFVSGYPVLGSTYILKDGSKRNSS